ncbi:hypothetical protein DYBT9275_04683 [Dyadobacter sp. CECT 9275]|uniref:Quercetin 2,3-dioxygenase C-terminal cupin domain-containing protein n=1 Tax=Dyadobacter helix TaxID=2822344 RepID=A0A916JGF2_9BACT|nr:hypothetical protein [Dyadobacter sp. CECT 9275]CAG5010288.1 hypothetical protein DYBT9275_04683 [Dyadobacter sp. CECT 9275]
MLTQTEAQIYLADLRGVTRWDGVRSLHTFNFNGYQSEGRDPFGQLLAFNEETIEAGKCLGISTEKPVDILLIPTVGGLELTDSAGESVFVGAGETFSFLAFPESNLTVHNPYPSETIQYLQIRLRPQFSENDLNEPPLKSFSLAQENVLVPVYDHSAGNASGYIGRYGGRQEDVFMLKNSETGLFCYIIQGAFEVQNRLLEKGDALSLKNTEEVGFEALSNEAIILLIEVGQGS